MKVNICYYTVYGLKTKYAKEFYDYLVKNNIDFNDYRVDSLIDVVTDFYDKEYTIFGNILFNGQNQRHEGIEDTFVEIDINGLLKHKRAYIAIFKERFPSFLHLLDDDWTLMTFMHYS